MKRAMRWVLGFAGLVGLALFLWIDGRSEQGQTEIRLGYPDAWLRSYDGPKESGWAMYFPRWSMGIGIAGAYALMVAVRSWRRSAVRKGKPLN